ncbi:lactococcin 972 family bacteriocin [Streptomyces sp. NPDC090021]|uniref:lactococcin 972 family bacteriocin n=1 Tax=Streptomyces sp. NPDC090021 TaxID=3365919 RepID=UPI003825ACAA
MQVSRMLKGAVAAGALVVAVAAPALAGESDVSGGKWYFGVTSSDFVYSNYYHPDRCHGSSAKGKYLAQSGNVEKDRTSYASAPEAAWGNQSYYRSNCS